MLSRPKPRQEDVRPLQSKWQVAQRKDKKPRPLEEVLREFHGKVIKAAQELQQELADSAEQPAFDGSTIAADEDPILLARLKEPADNAEQPVEKTYRKCSRLVFTS